MRPFIASSTAVLTATTSTQAVNLPTGMNSIVVYNAGANPVFLAYATTVAIPAATFADGVMCVQPGTTQTFARPLSASPLAYIASTAGGTLVVSTGEGL